jgi:hypothetical protein
LAAEVLENPDAYYEAAQAQLEKRLKTTTRPMDYLFLGKKSS